MKIEDLFSTSAQGALPIFAVTPSTLESALKGPLEKHAKWIGAAGFRAAAGKLLLLSGGEGGVAARNLFDCVESA
jgi:hypothetical protein